MVGWSLWENEWSIRITWFWEVIWATELHSSMSTKAAWCSGDDATAATNKLELSDHMAGWALELEYDKYVRSGTAEQHVNRTDSSKSKLRNTPLLIYATRLITLLCNYWHSRTLTSYLLSKLKWLKLSPTHTNCRVLIDLLKYINNNGVV